MQSQEQAQQSQLASLMAQNSVSGEEPRTNHEGQSSAAPMPNAEKWSHDALFTAEGIAARSKAIPLRMDKLLR